MTRPAASGQRSPLTTYVPGLCVSPGRRDTLDTLDRPPARGQVALPRLSASLSSWRSAGGCKAGCAVGASEEIAELGRAGRSGSRCGRAARRPARSRRAGARAMVRVALVCGDGRRCARRSCARPRRRSALADRTRSSRWRGPRARGRRATRVDRVLDVAWASERGLDGPLLQAPGDVRVLRGCAGRTSSRLHLLDRPGRVDVRHRGLGRLRPRRRARASARLVEAAAGVDEGEPGRSQDTDLAVESRSGADPRA